MISAKRAYLTGAAGVTLAMAASAVAGFLSLWFLTQILPKAVFGGYTFVMAVLALLSGIATLGLDRSLLLIVARQPVWRGKLHGASLIRRVIVITGLLACGLAVALASMAGWLVDVGMVPEAEYWCRGLAIALVPMTAAKVLQAWFQANHRVATASLMPSLTDVTRAMMLGLVLAVGLGADGVALAVCVAALSPVVVLIFLANGRGQEISDRLRLAEFLKGLQFLTMRLANQGMQQIDLIIIGLLVSGSATADYAVAARLAVLAGYGSQAIAPTFTPRVRALIAAGEDEAVRAEFIQTRNGAFSVTLMAVTAILLIGQPVLGLFGDFSGAWPLLLTLATGFVIKAGCGMHATLLAMHGEVGWSAVFRVIGLTCLILLAIVLVPIYGPIGAAISVVIVKAAMNAAGLWLTYRLVGFAAFSWMQALVIAAIVLALWLVAADLLTPLPVAAMIAAIALLIVRRSRFFLTTRPEE